MRYVFRWSSVSILEQDSCRNCASRSNIVSLNFLDHRILDCLSFIPWNGCLNLLIRSLSDAQNEYRGLTTRTEVFYFARRWLQSNWTKTAHNCLNVLEDYQLNISYNDNYCIAISVCIVCIFCCCVNRRFCLRPKLLNQYKLICMQKERALQCHLMLKPEKSELLFTFLF